MTTTLATQPDTKLERDVWNELTWDPHVKAEELRVEVHHGVVTLTGLVDDEAARVAATAAARRVCGVVDVIDAVGVKLDTRARPDEAVVCFECGRPIRSIEERGLAVAEAIVLCERCCEKHAPLEDSIAITKEVGG